MPCVPYLGASMAIRNNECVRLHLPWLWLQLYTYVSLYRELKKLQPQPGKAVTNTLNLAHS